MPVRRPAARAVAPTTSGAQSAIIDGSLSNFDISNDTGKVCHGFEIELEGVSPDKVPGSFSATHYGNADILPELVAEVEAPEPAEAAANVQPDSVVVTRVGGGRVSSADKVIDCGGKCAGNYVAGTQVTLTAKADSGSVFSGWNGACAGTGTCTVAAARPRAPCR